MKRSIILSLSAATAIGLAVVAAQAFPSGYASGPANARAYGNMQQGGMGMGGQYRGMGPGGQYGGMGMGGQFGGMGPGGQYGGMGMGGAQGGMMQMMQMMGQMHGAKGGLSQGAMMGGGQFGGMGPGAMIQNFDADKDGFISPDELRAGMLEELRTYDADGDGALSLEEYAALNAARVRTRMVDRFQALDDDGDGLVTEAEMAAPSDRMQMRVMRWQNVNPGQPEPRAMPDANAPQNGSMMDNNN